MTGNTTNHLEGISIEDWVFYSLLGLFAVALPASITASTVIQILFAANWLFSGDYREKLKRVASNKPILTLCAVFLVYLTAMLWTKDLENGFGKELLNKLPILTLPFFIASEKPINKLVINWLPVLFCLSVFVVSIIGSVMYYRDDLLDSRQLSPFINHIHFGNMVVLSVFWLPYSVQKLNLQKCWFFISIAISTWLLFFIFRMATLTSWIGLLLIAIFFGLYWLRSGTFDRLKKMVVAFLVLAMVFMIVLFIQLFKPLLLKKDYQGESTPLTSVGNPYRHDTDRSDRENGYLVFSFISDQELKEAWKMRSSIPFDSLGKGKNEIRGTVYRFLTSKGLKKDRDGLDQISDEEVMAIEQGIPNYLYIQWPSILVRVHQSLWELQRYALSGDPRGHTITQRLELWKAGWVAVREKPFLGWGTGDLPEAMKFGLRKIDSQMQTFMKPHNQFLYLLLMSGMAGTIIILFLLINYILRSYAFRHLPMKIALILFMVTMFSHTILDYQISLGFFLFCLLYFGEMNKWAVGAEK
jgi:hypothetical protein